MAHLLGGTRMGSLEVGRHREVDGMSHRLGAGMMAPHQEEGGVTEVEAIAVGKRIAVVKAEAVGKVATLAVGIVR